MTLGLDVHHAGERAQADDVLEQLPLARVAVGGVADLGERHADDVDVVAEFRGRQHLGVVVEHVAARLDLLQVLVPGLRVHRHHQVDAAAPAEPALLGHAHFVPGRQALDVGGEDVARRDRDAHAQDRAREQLVGRGRARAVDVGELDDEVVDGFDALRFLRAHAAFLGLFLLVSVVRASGPACGHLDERLLHVPGAGRAALGAQAAVQADVLVLGHDAAGFQRAGNVQILDQIQSRARSGACAGPFPRHSARRRCSPSGRCRRRRRTRCTAAW